MHVLDGEDVRLRERTGHVRQAVIGTELFDEALDVAQVVARQAREQVVLDLELQPAVHPVEGSWISLLIISVQAPQTDPT